MAHSLLRLKSSLVNTPHLMEQNSFKSVMDYINKRNELGLIDSPEMLKEGGGGSNGIPHYFPDTKTGILYVEGPLTNKTTGWEALCGGTSYEMLKGQMEDFVASGAKTVVMMANSGGGEAMGMMSSANYIRKLADENDIQILSFVEGMSASACYGLTCISDEIIMTSDSSVGSIGVLISLFNDSKNLEMQGYERSFISAGSQKIPWDEDGNFREGFLSRLQSQVDELYEGFTSHVAYHRNLSVEAVKGTEADVFMAKEALKLGLADKSMTLEEFYEYLAESAQSKLEGNTMGNPSKNRIFSFMQKEDVTEMAKLEELQAQLATAQEQVAGMSALTEQLATLTATLEQKESNLVELKAKLEGIETAKAEAAVAQRKTTLSALLPEDKVEESMSMYAGLDDATFSFVTSQLQATKDALAASGLMAEVGGEGVEQEAKAPEAGSPEDIVAKGKAAAQKLRK